MDEKKPTTGRLRRFLIFLATLVVVLAVIVVAAYRDGTGFDVLRRYFSYGTAEDSGSVPFTYDASTSNRFAAFGNGLALVSETTAQVMVGKNVYTQEVRMSQPAIDVGKDHVVVYDVGGTSLYVLSDSETVMELQAETEEPILSAHLNGSDYLTVTSEKKGRKGSVSVYDPEGEALFSFHSSDHFVTDGYVLEDCKTVAVITLGQKEGMFQTSVVLYPLDAEEPSGSYTISDGLVLDLGTVNGMLTTVSDTQLTFASEKGEVKSTYSYGGSYLREYDLGGSDFVPLLLNRYKAGSVGRLVTVNSSGEEIASLDVNDEVFNISAAGRYVAVLYADRLVIYTRELQEYAILMDTSSARDVLVRSDGSALLIESEEATLFLP